MNIEAFVITNGRSTFKYALRSMEEQSEKIKITVIRNMKWIDAVNECVKVCGNQYFVRVDDDMFLHPHYVSYIIRVLKRNKNVCMYSCRLWEDWQHKIAGTVKVYNTMLVEKMGGFRASKFGRIDKKFSALANKRKMLIVKDISIVGIHSCATFKEQERYRKLWAKENAVAKFIRPPAYLKAQRKYSKTLDEQYALLDRLKKKNKRVGTRFYRFLRKV